MAENISEIMSGLACIRGGLSVISENTDNINELLEKGEAIKKKIKDRKDEYYRFLDNCEAVSEEADFLKREIDEVKSDIELTKERIERTKREISEVDYKENPRAISKLAEKSRAIKKNARRAGRRCLKTYKIHLFPGEHPWRTTAIVMLVIAIISAMTYYTISCLAEADVVSNAVESYTFLATVIANIAYPATFLLLYPINCIKAYFHARNTSYREQWEKIVAAPNELRAELKKYEEELAYQQQHLENLKSQYNQHLIKIQKNEGTTKDQERHVDAFIEKAKYDISVVNDDIKKIRDNSIAIKQALAESYKDLISPADWQHIDVIMYYLETHRADSIKEALNIIDSKLQFEQLTNVITSSAEAVCGYIQSGFIKLNNNLIKSHEIIMDKLDDIEYKVDANRELIGSTAQVLARGIDRQVSEAKLNNALVKKAHKQIGELLEDMEFTTQVNVSVKV